MARLETPNVWMHTLFCEDVRHEVGGKKSYIGVYDDILTVPSFPALVSKLNVVLFIYVTDGEIPKALNVMFFRGDKVLFSGVIKEDEMASSESVIRGYPCTILKVEIAISDLEFNEDSSVHVLVEVSSVDGCTMLEGNRLSVVA